MHTSVCPGIQVDALQETLVEYAAHFSFEAISDEAVHAAEVRVLDTFGALIGGFNGAPCAIARNVAGAVTQPAAATVIGTRHRTSPDLAAFANATTSRYVEMNDVYHWPGSAGGHPSDVIMPIFAVAESEHANGRALIAGVVLAYEVYLRLADATHLPGFDSTVFGCLAVAMGAGLVMGLTPAQMRECISMAVVPNNALGQARAGHLSMWKAVAAGQAGRAGVFAAELARAGMQGPHLPFAGSAGWFDHVAHHRFSLGALGGKSTGFKVQDTLIKQRASCATTISSILAAELAHEQLMPHDEIDSVLVETYRRAKEGMATGEHHWHPTNRETADHSIPYVVAATLRDGTVGPAQFDQIHLRDPQLLDLLAKIEVVENPDFTADYEKHPVLHRTRVTVTTVRGDIRYGESGGAAGDLSNPKSDDEITQKFSRLAEPYLDPSEMCRALGLLWQLRQVDDVAVIPPWLVLTRSS